MYKSAGSGTARLHHETLGFCPGLSPINIVYRSDLDFDYRDGLWPAAFDVQADIFGCRAFRTSAGTSWFAGKNVRPWANKRAYLELACDSVIYCFCPEVKTVHGPAFISFNKGFCHEYSGCLSRKSAARKSAPQGCPARATKLIFAAIALSIAFP